MIEFEQADTRHKNTLHGESEQVHDFLPREDSELKHQNTVYGEIIFRDTAKKTNCHLLLTCTATGSRMD